ncbi:MAG: type IV secretion system DNA-binding domain-containing protein [Candidatus Andersenbacteria bacterium]|nr:type IV secretion system DNA-binding domain-containing protein [Candidatus Andersenbacteria bacterium]
MISFIGFLLLVIMLGLCCAGLFAIALLLRERARMSRSLDIQMLQVLLPKDMQKEDREEGIGQSIKERIAVGEQFLSTLSSLPSSWKQQFLYGKPVVVFEMASIPDQGILFFAGTERKYIQHLEKQIYAHYPEAEVKDAPEFTIFAEGDAVRVASFRLRRKEYLPIATYKELEVDPMQPLTGALAKMQSTDSALIQYILTPASRSSSIQASQATKRTMLGKQADLSSSSFGFSSILSAVTKTKSDRDTDEQRAGKMTTRMQQRIELVEAKMVQQQFSVNIRVGVSVRKRDDAERVFHGLASAFSQYDFPDLNQLVFKEPKNKKKFIEKMVFRVPDESSASVFGTAEISSMYHFPLPTTSTPNIVWRGAKSAPAPSNLPQDGVLIGVNQYRGIDTPVHISQSDRRRHMYLLGQTGTGKTTMFLNMIIQDIQAGNGVGVVDPHGDLISDILHHIPQNRLKDVVLFDPRDKDRPLGFNILESKNSEQRDLVVNEVVQILQKLAARLNPESIGPMFEHYLRNALLALVEDPQATLLDVPRMFVDEPFRKQILSKVTNPVVLQFWNQEFAQSQRGQMSADMLSYIISKLGRFISNDTVRNIIGQATSSFDVREIMDQKKILLCNLSKGELGDMNSDLLGFVLVSKIQIAALGRADIPENERNDFYLYLDEFQNFTTDSIATILSEARKYRLNLNLAHQFINQLDEPIADAVFGNVGTIVSYRIGVEDAEFMEKQFAPVFTQYDLVNLRRFTAVVRPLVNSTPERACSIAVPLPPAIGDPDIAGQIKENSRTLYGRSRADVEQEITSRFEGVKPNQQSDKVEHDSYMSESLFDIG